MYRAISPSKIVEQRGERSRHAIVSNVPGLTEQDLYAYEKGLHRPSDKKLASLIAGLGCTWDDISEPIDLVSA